MLSWIDETRQAKQNLLLFTVIFIKLFTIERKHCNLPPTKRVKEVLNPFPNITVRGMKSCIAKAKCSWCYLSHSVCSFDHIKKDWKYLPMCQETCKSYENLEPCAKLLLQLNHMIKDLVKYCRYVKIFKALDCTRYPKHKSDNCFYVIPGKHNDFVTMMLLFQRSGYWSCVSVGKWRNLVRKKRAMPNILKWFKNLTKYDQTTFIRFSVLKIMQTFKQTLAVFPCCLQQKKKIWLFWVNCVKYK